MNIIAQLDRFLNPLKRKIVSMIACALIKAVDDSKSIQLVKLSILKDELLEGVERIQQFGFTSVPPENSEAVILFVGGNRSHGLVIATESARYRLKHLPTGAVALYNQNGDYIKLVKDKIEVNAKEVTIKADVIQLGNESLNLEEGVVTGKSICAFTGVPHSHVSQKVKAVM